MFTKGFTMHNINDNNRPIKDVNELGFLFLFSFICVF